MDWACQSAVRDIHGDSGRIVQRNYDGKSQSNDDDNEDDPDYVDEVDEEDHMILYVASALLGLRYNRTMGWSTKDFELIYQAFVVEASRPLQIQSWFFQEPWMQYGIIYSLSYPEIPRTIDLLRYLGPRRCINGYLNAQPVFDDNEDGNVEEDGGDFGLGNLTLS